MKKVRLCRFGKEVKKKLIDIEQSQNWLIEQIRKDTGLFIDSSYLYKILTGKLNSPRIIESIEKILGIKCECCSNEDLI